ncbi:MAG: PQQ-binding-like beta-propeller repeat protein [Planctomycetia bacterium]|nr:PQQ-binding-like beta-propeller repeat protein [Planctomycetia bacterium]
MARFALVIGTILLAAVPAWGGDWPQWGGSATRNLSAEERDLPASFHPGKRRRDRLGLDPTTSKNVRWVVRIGGENYSSAVVAGGRVYVGTNDEDIDDPRFETTEGGVLLCLDEKSGRLLWRLVVPKLEIDRSKVSEDFDAMKLGICSTATVDDDRVYVVTNRCEALCLDADGMADGNDGPFTDEASFMVPSTAKPIDLGTSDADVVWRFDMLRDLPVFPHDATNCSILVVGDCAYVGTGNGVYDGKMVLPTAASLVALDKRTGRLLARDDGTISGGTFHGQWSSPTFAPTAERPLVVYGGGDGTCYGFELASAAGSRETVLRQAWKCDCNPPGYRVQDGKPIDYWALVRGGPRTLDRDGMLVSPSEIIGSPVFHGGRIYVTIGQDPLHGAGRGAITCLRADGSGDVSLSGVVWRYLDIGRSLSTVSIADGLVYAAEHTGKIHCLDAATGTREWVYDTREEIWSSTVVADAKVYVGTRRGLTVLQAGRERKHLADVRLGSAVWSVPTAANGTLFVASQKHLFAVENRGELP